MNDEIRRVLETIFAVHFDLYRGRGAALRAPVR